MHASASPHIGNFIINKCLEFSETHAKKIDYERKIISQNNFFSLELSEMYELKELELSFLGIIRNGIMIKYP